MMVYDILVVEDERPAARLLQLDLEQELGDAIALTLVESWPIP